MQPWTIRRTAAVGATLALLADPLLADGAHRDEPYLVRAARSWRCADPSALGVQTRSLGGSYGLTQLTYMSHQQGGRAVRIFGYYARPRGGGKLPGLIAIHGGGGYAERERALAGARQGFATLAIDLPGKGPGRSRSRSSGPDMTVRNIFATSDLDANYLVNSVRAVGRALTVLAGRPEVDPRRLHLYGISWGGVVALLVSSLDERVAGAVDLFGAGYVTEGSTWIDHLAAMPREQAARWEQELDPARHVGRIRCPVLMVTGTRDGCYWLPSFLSTYHDVGGPADLLLRPNLDHKIDDTAREALWRWLRVRAGLGPAVQPSLTCRLLPNTGGGLSLRGAVHGEEMPVAVSLYRAPLRRDWARLLWDPVPCTMGQNGQITATLDAPRPGIYAFLVARYASGLAVSTPVHTIVHARVYGWDTLVDMPTVRLRHYLLEVGWLERALATRGVALPQAPLAKPAETVRLRDAGEWEPVPSAAARLGLKAVWDSGQGLRIGVPGWPDRPTRGEQPSEGEALHEGTAELEPVRTTVGTYMAKSVS